MLKNFSLGEVEGGSASVPSLAVVSDKLLGTFMDQIDLVPPSSWRLSWQPVQSDNETKNETRSLSRYRVGFRVRIELAWGALSVTDRAELVAKINANVSQIIRVWPHKDNTAVFYDCFISEETNIDRYPAGAPIGYQGQLVLVGERIYEDIPIFTAMESYNPVMIKRCFYYTDSTLIPGTSEYYLDSDPITHYTDPAQIANYQDDDRVGFYKRDPRAIGG